MEMTDSMKKSLDAIAKWGKITGVFMIIAEASMPFSEFLCLSSEPLQVC
ncbi:hypothetical protein CHCC14688_3773 [Bacillus licheniformis]|nr:hypothetical protein CHCC14688_3773 [Bacillus licheniformis]